jgi:RNA polymerase sigma factor (TIGR02999 family)
MCSEKSHVLGFISDPVRRTQLGVEDRQALDLVFSLAYGELRRIASSVLRDYAQATLTPTSLVNEAWFKLARSPEVAQTSPLHFKRIAARAMRQVLVEAARRRATIRRGSGMQIAFDESIAGISSISDGRDILALDAALDDLNRISPRQATLVEGRFFGGLDVAESAELMGVSRATVMREWRYARAWLACRTREYLEGDAAPTVANKKTP